MRQSIYIILHIARKGLAIPCVIRILIQWLERRRSESHILLQKAFQERLWDIKQTVCHNDYAMERGSNILCQKSHRMVDKVTV